MASPLRRISSHTGDVFSSVAASDRSLMSRLSAEEPCIVRTAYTAGTSSVKMNEMYPVLFRIGEVEITSFGVLVGIAALVGIWVFTRELERSGLDPKASDAAVAGVIGGLLGAKLLWTIEFSGTAPFADLLFSRGGLSWFGGLIGGVGTGLWMLRRRRVALVSALAAASPA